MHRKIVVVMKSGSQKRKFDQKCNINTALRFTSPHNKEKITSILKSVECESENFGKWKIFDALVHLLKVEPRVSENLYFPIYSINLQALI